MTELRVPWPNGCRCAVVITVHLDAELLWLRLDPSVVDRPKTQSIGSYGAKRGVWRVLTELREAEVPSTWFIPSSMAVRYERVVAAIVSHGHEIACRGEGLERLGALDRAAQYDVLARSADQLETLTGGRPTGFRPFEDITGDTVDVLLDLGFEWSSMTRGDDRPLELHGDSEKSLVDIPYHWELQDVPAFMFNYGPPFPAGQSRIAEYKRVASDWKAEFDAYRDRGLCMVLTLDPQAIGTPGRISILNELLDYMREHPDVWFATGREVAEFWRGHGPRENAPTSEEVRIAAATRHHKAARGPWEAVDAQASS